MNYKITGFATKADFKKKKVGFTDSRTTKKLALEYVEIIRGTEEYYAVVISNGKTSETIIFE